MSETVLIASIGVAGTAFAGIVVALVTGLLNYHNQKLQLKSQGETLDKELKHQQEEMKRSRIVETRKTYLVPLREHLVSWLAAINVSQGAMTQLTTADVTYFTPEQLGQLKDYAQQWQASAIVSFMSFISQMSDGILEDQLLELWKNESSGAAKVAQTVNDGTAATNIEALVELVSQVATESKGILLLINKRIEEVLTGVDPS